MIIAIVLPCANMGGTEVSWLEHALHLRAEGLEPRFLTLHEDTGFGRVLERNGFGLRHVGYRGPFGVASVPALLSHLRAVSPACVVCVTPSLPMLAACLVGRYPAICSMDTHHAASRFPFRWPAIYRLCDMACRHIVCPTDYLRREIAAFHPGLRRRIAVVPYRLDSPTFAGDDGGRSLQFEECGKGGARIGFIGQLIPRKRPDLFVELARELKLRGRNDRFVVAGSGDCEQSMKERVSEAGLQESFAFLGAIRKTGEFYRSMDAVFFASEVDALGRVPFESLSHGTPVVGYLRRGGLREYLRGDTPYCRLQDKDDVRLIARDLIELLTHHEDREARRAECMRLFSRIRTRNTSRSPLVRVIEATVNRSGSS